MEAYPELSGFHLCHSRNDGDFGTVSAPASLAMAELAGQCLHAA